MFAPVYLDYNASAPLDDAVREAMLPWLGTRFGNASSRHEYGRAARRAIDEARAQVAAAVNAHPTEVVFTSGGSEANNLFVKGAAARLKPGAIAVSAIEHPCVREPARQLVRSGWTLQELPVDAQGRVRVEAYDGQAMLVSMMRANNETGVLQDVAALAESVRRAGGWLHSDAVQALGKVGVDFRALGVSAMTLSAHKIGGPQGAGALILDKRVDLEPLIAGGGHERGLRSGTENIAAIVGFGHACERAVAALDTHLVELKALRERIERCVAALGGTVFGDRAERLPNTCYFALDRIDGETLVGKLDRAGFAVASGAACSSASPEPSRTLMAMGVAPELARGAVRVSTGAATGMQDVDDFCSALAQVTDELRSLRAMAAA
ncbi:MAG: cysteine desulfurase [Gammaproteobacteria bacterium]|jgi:cysteine desulfurase|nr:cysteine desulfurase [Gammaproteobacteria bacterium]MBU0771579.1 cysteine desulfurase [Gammaproteobacteria bacterium]MBU0857748.1 cysteine desulfurase [Gammaproteobacteria bacterium]MBU1845311.1 cysteine desulfurase [Gammaproteobacteria bacterium]